MAALTVEFVLLVTFCVAWITHEAQILFMLLKFIL
jgi:hypothetical protein